jgi:sulfonate transport system substrate-binding protein
MGHTIRRFRYLAAIVLVAGSLTAAGCSSNSTSNTARDTASAATVDLSKVTLNIGDQKGTGAQAILKAAGLLSTLPFKATWATFTSGPPMLQAMGTGAIDIGGVGDAPPVFAASGGENIEIVGARKTDFDRDAVVVPKGSPITSIQQLKGKKIAYGSGSSANYNLLTVLGKAGLSTKDVNLVSLQPAPALAAFTSGAVDAWDIWPPYVQQAVTQYGARILASGPEYGSPYSFQVASKSALSDPAKSAAIKSYLAIINKAYVWAAQHPQAWATAWAAAAGLPAGIMLQAAKVSATTPVPSSTPSRTWSTSSSPRA